MKMLVCVCVCVCMCVCVSPQINGMLFACNNLFDLVLSPHLPWDLRDFTRDVASQAMEDVLLVVTERKLQVRS